MISAEAMIVAVMFAFAAYHPASLIAAITRDIISFLVVGAALKIFVNSARVQEKNRMIREATDEISKQFRILA